MNYYELIRKCSDDKIIEFARKIPKREYENREIKTFLKKSKKTNYLLQMVNQKNN